MRLLNAIVFLILLSTNLYSQTTVHWVSTTQTSPWKKKAGLTTTKATSMADVEIEIQNKLQSIDGFGTCFNELGWTSLSLLSDKDRQSIFRELFKPDYGASFNLCRMPVAANDFSTAWYSYNETDQDFEMKNFSIAQDLKTLVPFIKSAQKYKPSLKIWASPWSPPTWMKTNKHYALKPSKYNDLQAEQSGSEFQDMFIQKDEYFKAYALYFEKFVKAYRQQNIYISMVMPQNEFVAAQIFPSCTWTAQGLGKFIGYLAPKMNAMKVDVFFGTMNSDNDKFVDTIMQKPAINKYIKGVGIQWAGKGAIAALNKNYPNLSLYQTEQECGDGKNDWKYCLYTWDLMKQYLNNGANAYTYWNTSLKEGGISTWGWQQNSLISVDTLNKTFKYNHEYYLMKHLSHYVKPGAKRLKTNGTYTNLLSFINPDKSIVIVAHNPEDSEKAITFKIGNKKVSPVFEASSFNTLVIRQ
ncbi:beta-glycosidase [Flavobacterium cupreum]|uniref:Beta-glycosidase n=2 Tax=Flavobacterium TaxID=237 RepID=A0A4Y7UF18_9FLAO|nr:MULTISPECIES: glycoside hydrolase family 30 beta sandwich domain-containing protein [Flavobacterium]RUT68003.1 beta-glycosidase [Flavobacterium cupreum]TCN59033.1 glucosylceramidase [Flavobacterium circumlabens]TEB44429.1 beta-glycosidase [Flavobacterium circumlabens]